MSKKIIFIKYYFYPPKKDFMKIYKNFFSTSTFLEDLVKVCEEKNAKIYYGSKLVYKFDKNNTPVDNEK